MIHVLVQFRAQPGKEAEAEAAIKAVVAAVEENEPGAVMYTFLRNRKDPGLITVEEIWQDEAAVEAHREQPHQKRFNQAFRDLFDPATVSIQRQELVAGFNRP